MPFQKNPSPQNILLTFLKILYYNPLQLITPKLDMTIVVIPSDRDVPLIQDVEGTPEDIRARANAFFKTAAFIEHAGGEITVGPEEKREAREIYTESPLAPRIPSNSGTSLHLKALLDEYDFQVLESNIQARNFIVNRLLDITNPHFRKTRSQTGEEVVVEPAKITEQLKALELLGKVSEIGLFTERVEVNINNKSTEDLEAELVATLTKYMGQAVPEPNRTDILGGDLDAELGRK